MAVASRGAQELCSSLSPSKTFSAGAGPLNSSLDPFHQEIRPGVLGFRISVLWPTEHQASALVGNTVNVGCSVCRSMQSAGNLL